MALVLLQVLDWKEWSKLPKDVQNKLEIFVKELQNVNESLKRHHEHLYIKCVWQTFMFTQNMQLDLNKIPLFESETSGVRGMPDTC